VKSESWSNFSECRIHHCHWFVRFRLDGATWGGKNIFNSQFSIL